MVPLPYLSRPEFEPLFLHLPDHCRTASPVCPLGRRASYALETPMFYGNRR